MLDTQSKITPDTDTLDFFDFKTDSFQDKYLKSATNLIKPLRQNMSITNKPKMKCNVGFTTLKLHEDEYQDDLQYTKFTLVFYRDYLMRGFAIQDITLTRSQFKHNSDQKLAKKVLTNYALWLQRHIARMKTAAKTLDFKVLMSSVVPKMFKRKRRTYVMSDLYIDDVFTRKSLISLIVNHLPQYANDGEYWHDDIPSKYYYLKVLLSDKEMRDWFVKLIFLSDNLEVWLNNIDIYQLLSIVMANSQDELSIYEKTLYRQLIAHEQQFTNQLLKETVQSLDVIHERITNEY